MAHDGETVEATPAETLANLRENPELMTMTSFPNLGFDFYVGYEPESGTYKNRVVITGHEVNDEDAIQVDETGLSEEEVLWHFEVLIRRDQEVNNPLAAMLRQMAEAGLVLNLDDDEDD